MKTKYILEFTQEAVNKPVTYQLIKDFDLKVNIINADISANKQAYLLIDISGKEQNIKDGIKYMEDLKVKCKLFRKQLIYDKENCVNCGSCTGVCYSGALYFDNSDKIVNYNSEKCTVCGLCIKACPLQLFELNLGFKNADNN